MKGKIGLEEHFAIDDTLERFEGVLPRRHLDRGARPHPRPPRPRLRLMDEFGMQMMILSLNAPAIQAIPDAKKANEIARKANDYLAEQVQKRPDRFQALAALPLQDPDMAAQGTAALRQGPRHGRRAGQRLLADRRSQHDRLSRREAVLAVLERVRAARRAVLSASAQSAAAGRAHLQGARMAAGPDLGVRPRDRGACAAADGLRPVRQASEAADHPRPHGRGPAVQHLARRQSPTPGFRTATIIRPRRRSAIISRTTSTSPCPATSTPRRCSTP